MRAIFVAIVVLAVAYLGWVIYRESRHAAPSATSEPVAPVTTETAQDFVVPPPVEGRSPQVARPLSIQSQGARPGIYYALERVTTQSETGVKALHPGEQVWLMYRNKNGTMLVTNGKDEFVVKPSALTPDPELARRAASP